MRSFSFGSLGRLVTDPSQLNVAAALSRVFGYDRCVRQIHGGVLDLSFDVRQPDLRSSLVFAAFLCNLRPGALAILVGDQLGTFFDNVMIRNIGTAVPSEVKNAMAATLGSIVNKTESGLSLFLAMVRWYQFYSPETTDTVLSKCLSELQADILNECRTMVHRESCLHFWAWVSLIGYCMFGLSSANRLVLDCEGMSREVSLRKSNADGHVSQFS